MDARRQFAVDVAIHGQMRTLLVVDADLTTRFPERQIVWLHMEAFQESWLWQKQPLA